MENLPFTSRRIPAFYHHKTKASRGIRLALMGGRKSEARRCRIWRLANLVECIRHFSSIEQFVFRLCGSWYGGFRRESTTGFRKCLPLSRRSIRDNQLRLAPRRRFPAPVQQIVVSPVVVVVQLEAQAELSQPGAVDLRPPRRVQSPRRPLAIRRRLAQR